MGERRFKLKEILQIIIVSSCFFFMFYGIQYTDDMNGYMVEYEEKVTEIGSDIGFVAFENICRYYNIDFYNFYYISIAIQLLLFCWVFKRYGVNMIIAMICLLLTSYVQMANQIRYFIAFPLFLLSVYYFFISNKKILSIILAIISLSFHGGIIALYTFVPIYFIFRKKQIPVKRQILLYSISGFIVFVLFQFLFSFIVQVNSHFSEYNEIASVLGNLFAISYSVICLFFIYFTTRSNLKAITEDCRLNLLHSLSFFPIVFIIASFAGLQIVIARYVNVFISVWIILILLVTKKYDRRFYYPLAFIIIAFLTRHVLSEVLLGSSDLQKVLLIWASKSLPM